jgi:hypothetical protein
MYMCHKLCALHFVNSCTWFSLVHSIVHNSNCEVVTVVNFHEFNYKMSEMFGEKGPKFPRRVGCVFTAVLCLKIKQHVLLLFGPTIGSHLTFF